MAIPTKTLNDGWPIPAIGLGTHTFHGDDGVAALESGIETGFRLLDTAYNYDSEREVGEAVRRSGLDRGEFFVTSKLPGRHQGADSVRQSFMETLERLGFDYLDLYLIHWPLPRVNKYAESWQVMLELREEGLVRSVGVSNFLPEHLERIITETGVVPAVNQVELHPFFPQGAQRALHDERGIVTQSWSPLARGRDLITNPVTEKIAAAHGVAGGQVVLRWHVQIGAIPIPRSTDPGRQRSNFDVFSFELSESEVAEISALETGRLWGADPATYEEF